ncbi:hypothetical protein BC941DRAFT_467110 [Chlamydoabsidia padenii]|nr:hypothetical protein BC941DRAFT_467110 [Chlamydoabsidia padenii]
MGNSYSIVDDGHYSYPYLGRRCGGAIGRCRSKYCGYYGPTMVPYGYQQLSPLYYQPTTFYYPRYTPVYYPI